MKKVTCLAIVVFIGSLTIIYFGRFERSKGEDVVSQKDIPSISKGHNIKLSQRESIFSVFLLTDNILLSAQVTKPDIVKFGLESNGSLTLVSRYERNAWQINKLTFIDSVKGFAVGDYGTLLKTEDGGQTWKQMPRVSDYDLIEAAFLNQSIGYVAGKRGVRNKKTNDDEWEVAIWKTNDGGNSWTQSFHAKNERYIYQIYNISADIALASVDSEYVVRTADGGNTWSNVPTQGKQVNSISFGSDKTGWLVGYDGNFLKSIDGGITWDATENLPGELLTRRWSSVSLGITGRGLAVAEDGDIAYTIDNGKNWVKFPQKLDEPLRIAQVHENVGIILGSNNIYRVDF